jgi:hypothetical protein
VSRFLFSYRLSSQIFNSGCSAAKDDIIPFRFPIPIDRQQAEIRSVPIPTGTDVRISIISANTSTKFWGNDAREWKPERWLSSLPTTVMEGTLPGVFPPLLTFFHGPRGTQVMLLSYSTISILLFSFQLVSVIDLPFKK